MDADVEAAIVLVLPSTDMLIFAWSGDTVPKTATASPKNE